MSCSKLTGLSSKLHAAWTWALSSHLTWWLLLSKLTGLLLWQGRGNFSKLTGLLLWQGRGNFTALLGFNDSSKISKVT
jgi:hypothetical protein